MVTEDYILRMIQDLGRMLARLLQSDALEPEALPLTLEESKPAVLPLLEELRRQCDLGQINQAEDRLFEEVDFSDPATLPTVLGFYQYLNHYTDRQLESWDYSREEIFDGLRDCAVCYGADPQLAEAFRP